MAARGSFGNVNLPKAAARQEGDRMYASKVAASVLITLLLISRADAQTQRASGSLHFLSKQCNEDAIRIHVDPGPFHDVVATPSSLVLEEGKAVILILGQDCAQHWMDGEPMGPTQEMHVWVAIEGVNDVRPVVGAQETRPTMTWFSVFDGNTNGRARKARLASGCVQVPIEAVVIDPPGPTRGGRISVAKGLRYSWRVSSSPATARLVGVNHDVYARDPAGNIVLSRIQALLNTAAAGSHGTLEVVGSTDRLPLIRAGTHPISVNTFFPVWIRATLGITPSR
jgi:hypothetical protein